MLVCLVAHALGEPAQHARAGPPAGLGLASLDLVAQVLLVLKHVVDVLDLALLATKVGGAIAGVCQTDDRLTVEQRRTRRLAVMVPDGRRHQHRAYVHAHGAQVRSQRVMVVCSGRAESTLAGGSGQPTHGVQTRPVARLLLVTGGAFMVVIVGLEHAAHGPCLALQDLTVRGEGSAVSQALDSGGLAPATVRSSTRVSNEASASDGDHT